MRTFLALAVLALGVPLAGCYSVTAPKEIPEWAMVPQGADAPAQADPHRHAAASRPSAIAREPADSPPGFAAASAGASATDAPPPRIQPTSTQSTGLTRAVVRRKPTALTDGSTPTPTAPALQARDPDATRVINSICRGC